MLLPRFAQTLVQKTKMCAIFVSKSGVNRNFGQGKFCYLCVFHSKKTIYI